MPRPRPIIINLQKFQTVLRYYREFYEGKDPVLRAAHIAGRNYDFALSSRDREFLERIEPLDLGITPEGQDSIYMICKKEPAQ